MKQFTATELQAEWARAAVLASLAGLHVWGWRTATLHRFLTTPSAV